MAPTSRVAERKITKAKTRVTSRRGGPAEQMLAQLCRTNFAVTAAQFGAAATWWWGNSSSAFRCCWVKTGRAYTVLLDYATRRSSRLHTRAAIHAPLLLARCDRMFHNLPTWQNCYSFSLRGFALLAFQWQSQKMAKPSNHITVQQGEHLNANVISSHT